MWFLFWNENALIYHVTWEILLASCRGGKRVSWRFWWSGGAWHVCDAWGCLQHKGLPWEPPACCKAIPVIQGLVPEAVTTEISLSKYWVDGIIALVQRCVWVSSEFEGAVFKWRAGSFPWISAEGIQGNRIQCLCWEKDCFTSSVYC